MIRIMHITNDMERGGVQGKIVSLLKNLKPGDMQFYVATVAGSGPLFTQLGDLGIQTRYFPCIGRAFFLRWINIYQVWKLSRWIRELKIDIVRTHLFLGGFIGRIAALLTRAPIIIHTEHNTYVWKRFYHIWIDRFLARFTKNIVAVSEEVRRFTIEQERIDKDKFVFIYNGIDLRDFNIREENSLKGEFKIPQDSILVGSIGRLVSQKGFGYLLAAARDVLKVIPHAYFLIIGDGPLRDSLQRIVERSGISRNVIFTGYRRDIPRILGSLDIFVLSSLIEGLPNALMEAMVCARPVIATRVGGIPELISQNENGLLVYPRDSQALCDAIISLLKDRDKARMLGEAAKRLVTEKFGIDNMAKETERLYREMITEICE